MAGTGRQGPGISGALRLTWVTDHLAHVIDSSEADEASGTWTDWPVPTTSCRILLSHVGGKVLGEEQASEW